METPDCCGLPRDTKITLSWTPDLLTYHYDDNLLGGAREYVGTPSAKVMALRLRLLADLLEEES